MARTRHRIGLVALLVCAVCVTALYLWPLLMAAPNMQEVSVRTRGDVAPSHFTKHVRVVCANLAHGRGVSGHQMFQSTDQITGNISAVLAVLKRVGADLVCAQELDDQSWWTGPFSHVDALLQEYRCAVHGPHVDGLGLHYGTGVLSRFKIERAYAYTFPPTPPTMSKGFTVATIPNPLLQAGEYHVVSVHLDFASISARRNQLRLMADYLSTLSAPVMVIGDFNAHVTDHDSGMVQFLERLGLKTYQPLSTSDDLVTFPFSNTRIDWICIPEDWTFQTFQVLTDQVSDHRFIVADIAFTSN